MNIIVTAGGTGGHIMPAVAIAEAVREMDPDTKILFVGTDRGMEERIASLNRLDFIAVKSLGIKGKSAADILKAGMVNLRAFLKAFRIIKEFKPAWIIGTGGYITGMVVLAGYLLGCRCAIQEQNSVPGLTNRLLSRIASRIFLAFPDTLGRFPASRTLLTGNPLRRELSVCTREGYGTHLLVLGGSLGAGSVNRAATKALQILRDEGVAIKVIHQCGSRDFEQTRDAYRRLGLEVDVRDFIDDMVPVYKGAFLALSRCGGITLSELSAIGIPAIMVPFPRAADDHQAFNGRYVADNGGGWLIPEPELTPERLAIEIQARLSNPDELRKASENMKRIGLGKGAETIAREILRV